MRDIGRFCGCLLGGAAGDALGYAVEFENEDSIFKKYGQEGITSYRLRNGIAVFSDDTQMTLFTAEGLMRGRRRGDYVEKIRLAYLDWLKTQEEDAPETDMPKITHLARIPSLYSRRAPGNTCINALMNGGYGSVMRPVNHSKGCGGVMRVAPIGLFLNDTGADIKNICRLGAEAAAITHGHILGWLPAAILVQIIHEVSQNGIRLKEAVSRAIETANEMWPATDELKYCTSLIKTAARLAEKEQNDLAAIHQLGEGWVAEETLAIAVYCAMKYEHDFDKALIASVNHRGDSDSTGAVTGNILGAELGIEGIPDKYTQQLESAGLITDMATALWSGGYPGEDEV